jgi:hypothetical protein
LTNDPNENRILLHSLLKEIQEWIDVVPQRARWIRFSRYGKRRHFIEEPQREIAQIDDFGLNIVVGVDR